MQKFSWQIRSACVMRPSVDEHMHAALGLALRQTTMIGRTFILSARPGGRGTRAPESDQETAANNADSQPPERDAALP